MKTETKLVIKEPIIITPSKDYSNADILSMSIKASAKKSNEESFQFDIRHGASLRDQGSEEGSPFQIPQFVEQSSPPAADYYHDDGEGSFVVKKPKKFTTSPEARSEKTNLRQELQDKLHQIIIHQYLDLLLTGTTDQLMRLKGIGKVRTARIIELRRSKSGNKNQSPRQMLFEILSDIGMGGKAIDRFLQGNVNAIVGL